MPALSDRRVTTYATSSCADRSRAIAVFRARLIASYLVLGMVIMALAEWNLRESRQASIAAANAITENLARTLGYGISSTFDRVDYALQVIADELHRRHEAGKPVAEGAGVYLRRQERRVPDVYGIFVADRNGILVHGNGVDAQKKVSIADRRYFAELRDNPNAGMVVSDPIKGRLTGSPQIVIARRIDCADQGFCGVVFAPIYIHQFVERFSKLAVGADGIIFLRANNSALVVRYPALAGDRADVGSTALSPELKKLMEAGYTSGNFVATSPVDGIRRVLAYLAIPGAPLYLVVGLGIDEYLTAWSAQRTYTYALGAIFLLLVGGAFWKLYRSWVERLVLEEEIHALAFYDPLTHAANRRLFCDRLGQARMKRSRTFGAVLYIDLDRFKAVNDALGHSEGDRVLQLVAARLNVNVREGDTVSRFGGDEFVILLEDLGDNYEAAVSNALTAAEKIRNELNAPYELVGAKSEGWVCTPSIGVAVFSGASESVDEILSRADQALLEAKDKGRNMTRINRMPLPETP